MKKKKGYISLTIKSEEKKQNIEIAADELKQVIKEAKLGKDAEDINLRFETEDGGLNVPMKMKVIQLLIKTAELMVNLVPNSLRNYLTDITQSFAKEQQVEPTVAGRDNEIEKIWFYLSQKTRNNAFLIGDTDVGKTALANEIIRQIATNECPKEFFNKRVLMFNPEKILKIDKDFIAEREVKRMFNFIVKHKKEIVLYVDKALYMKTDYWLIRMLYAIIINYKIPFITTCSIEDYDDYFSGDSDIAKYLNEVYVEEPELEEVQPMLESHIEVFKKKYKVNIEENMIKFGIYTSCLSE